MRRNMKITVFLEGSPGHEKQSLAVVTALQSLVEVDVEQIKLPKVHVLQRIIDFFRLFLLPNGGCRYSLYGTDMVIGTGSRTHAAVLSCKKKFKIPAVTCMTPEVYLRSMFDLLLVPKHDGVDSDAENVFLTEGPPVLPAAPFPRDMHAGLILLGGIDPRSHDWNTSDIILYINKIIDSYKELHWTISSSPRTPEDTVREVEEIEKRYPQVTFFHYKDTPSGWVEEQYARANVTWVTADSMSMIYEAITAGCRVGVLPVKWKKTEDKFQRSLQNLYQQGYAAPLDMSEEKCMILLDQVDFDEARRCAREILARFFKNEDSWDNAVR
jgi:mitochondrial fission protein ELM1